MSLTNKGNISNIASAISSFGELRGWGTNSVKSLASTINQFTDIADVQQLLLKSGVSSSVAESALGMSRFKNSTEEVTSALNALKSNEAIKDLGDTEVILSRTTSGFKSLGIAIKEFANTPVGVASITAGLLMIYGTIMEKLNPSLEKMNDLATNKLTNYQNAQSEVESVQSKLTDVKSQIDEINSQPLTVATQNQLDKLNMTKTQLEQQLQIKQNIAKVDQNAAAEAAKAAMLARTSNTVSNQVSGNKITDTINKTAMSDSASGYAIRKGLDTMIGAFNPYYLLANTIEMVKGNGGSATFSGRYKKNSQTELQSVTEDLKKYKELKAQTAEINNKLAVSDQSEKYYSDLNKQLETAEKNISTLSSDLGTKQTSIQEKITAMTDSNGDPLKGYEQQVNMLKTYMNQIGQISSYDMTPAEKNLDSISRYFANGVNSNTYDYLKSLADSGMSVDNMSRIISGLGVSIDDLSSNDIATYFANMAAEANNAADATTNVETALSSVNSGDAFVSMNDYLSKAKDLYDQGLTGTDDFKSIAELISPGSDSSADNFEANYENVMKYFTTDGNGNLSKSGISEFVDEFDAMGQTFTTTGEAANSMGLSVEVFEALMGRMKDYDMSFATQDLDSFISSTKKLDEGKQALQGLKDTMDSLSEGKQKDYLKNQIEGWDAALAGYESDVSSLDPVIIARIQFEYDLAQLQQKIDEANTIAKAEGYRNTQDNANLIAAKENYQTEFVDKSGLKNVIDKKPTEEVSVVYKVTEQAKQQLYADMANATSEEEAVGIQVKINNLIDVTSEMLNAFSNAHPEITPETDVTQAASTWNDFINSQQGKEILQKYDIDDTNARKIIDSVINGNYEAVVGLQADDSGVLTVTKNTDGGTRITTFTPEASSVTDVTNTKDGGTRTTTFNSDLSIVDKAVSNTDGGTRITNFDPSLFAIDAVAGNKDGGTRIVKYSPDTGALPTSFSALTRTVYYNYVNNGGDSSLYLSGEHSLNGTAHMYGTAGHAFAGGNWGTKETHNALVGELGPELVVNGSNWYTVGTDGAEFTKIPRGSIVFNHKQTEEIFRNGYVSASNGGGRGHALAGGTAFASGTAFADGSGDSDSFSEEFDRAAIALELINRVLDNVKSSIDDYSHNLAEQNAKSERALQLVQGSIDYNRAGYETYMAKANAVDLDDEWKRKIRDGAWEVDDITDESLKNKLDDYKNYYDKAIKCQDAIQTATSEFADVAKQKLSNIENHFSNIVDYNKDFGIYQSVSELKDALSQYQSDLDSEVSRGYIKEYSDNWYKSMTQIADYMQDIFDATINDFTTIINGLESASKNLENAEKLKEANGSTINESDYQSQIDNNNKLIQEYAQKRQVLLKQQSTYDAGTDKYKDLADDIDSADNSIYDLISANEKLKDSIYELRFKPLDDGIKKMQSLVDETDDFRDLLNDDAFYDENGILSAEGAANIALITQNLGSVKQEIADYRTGLEKLQESLDNNVISQEEYNEKSEDYISGAQKAAKSVSSYREALLKMNETQMKADNSSLKENITLRKNALKATKDYYDYQETLKSKTKDVNALKAQIAALSGVNNAASQAKLKSLKSDLADAQDELTNTKRDHAYDMITDGYDTMADNLDDTLEKTTNAINESSEKQEEVISSMLNSIVGKYSDAYSKINEIVSTTGWIWSSTGAINAGQIGTSAGISSSISSALKSVSNTSGSSYASNVSSTGVKDNSAYNSSLTTSMSGDNDTTNRKCGSLTLSTSSMTLQAGSSGNISVNIKPNDAANKTILWTSSNPTVATVSSGIISAISAGAATIIASTTDGSNLSAVCGLSVSPKPQEQPSNGGSSSGGSSSSGGGGGSDYSDNGIPFEYQVDYTDASNLNTNTSIVDRLKYFNYASDFNHRKILYDYFHANDGVDYVGSAYQNMQLIEDMKVRGYASGTRSAMSGLAFTNEEGLGTELMLTKGGALQQLNGGETIFSKAQTEKLWQLSKNNISDSLGQGGRSSLYNVERAESSVDVHFDNLINVEGNVDKDALPGLQEICEKAYDYTTNRIKKEIRKI